MREPDVQGVLFAGTRGDEREKLKESYKGIKVILDPTIRRLLETKIADSIKRSEDPESYKIAKWGEFQADGLGYRRALREILALLP